MNREEVLSFSKKKIEKSETTMTLSRFFGILSLVMLVAAAVLSLAFPMYNRDGTIKYFYDDLVAMFTGKFTATGDYIKTIVITLFYVLSFAYLLYSAIKMLLNKCKAGANFFFVLSFGAIVMTIIVSTEISEYINSLTFKFAKYLFAGAFLVKFFYDVALLLGNAKQWKRSGKTFVIPFLIVALISGLAIIYAASFAQFGDLRLSFKTLYSTLYQMIREKLLTTSLFNIGGIASVADVFVILAAFAFIWFFIELGRTIASLIINVLIFPSDRNFVRGSKYFSRSNLASSALRLTLMPILWGIFSTVVVLIKKETQFNFLYYFPLANLIAFGVVLLFTILVACLFRKDKKYSMLEEPEFATEVATEEVVEEAPAEEVVEEVVEEVPTEEVVEEVVEDVPVEEVVEEVPTEEVVEEAPAEEIIPVVVPVEEPSVEEAPAEEVVEEAPAPEVKEEPKEEVKEEPKATPQAQPCIMNIYPNVYSTPNMMGCGMPMPYYPPMPNMYYVPMAQPMPQYVMPPYYAPYGYPVPPMAQPAPQPAPATQPAPAPAPQPEPAPAPAPVVEAAASEDEETTAFAIQKKTLDEKVAELPSNMKTFYKQICDYATKKEGVKHNKNTFADTFYYGRDCMLKIQIKQSKIVCSFSLLDLKAREMVKEGKYAKDQQTVIKIVNRESLAQAKSSFDIAYQLVLEAREARHQEQLRKRREARQAKANA